MTYLLTALLAFALGCCVRIRRAPKPLVLRKRNLTDTLMSQPDLFSGASHAMSLQRRDVGQISTTAKL